MTRFYSFLFLFLVWSPTTVQAQAITSFSPASGNVGTLVTLTGTRLDLVTAVAVNGTSSVILDQTSTALRLLVMPGATTGPLTTTGGAPATAAAAFTVTRTALGTAQQGPRLVGTGASSYVDQGQSVALSADGNTLAVGGTLDNSNTGATWVFTRSGTGWSQQGPKLVGTGAVGKANQGYSVALSTDGNTLAVSGLNDNNYTGATWVFTRSGTSWGQQGPKLVGTGVVGSRPYQGYSVVLSADGNTLAVGGPSDNNYTGATWVFVRSGTNWGQQGPKLVGTGTPAGQGRAVALSADGNTLAVSGEDDNFSAGATWVFVRSGTSWGQQGPKLVGSGAVGSAEQGASLALSADGSTLAVGGPLDNRHAGATWVFVRSGTSWGQQGPKLVGSGALGSADQGTSVALSADGSTLAVGGSRDLRTEGGSWFLRTGATWVFSTASSPLQRPAAGPRATASFFPNPVAEQLTVTGGARTGTWRLLDSTGRTRLTGTYHAGQPLDLSALPAGLYWLQVDQAPARPLLKR
ncbi:hypothetical protein GCM10011495_31210 [Hymenobacter frigidus]|uniref:IPT/TIG domain-containing protein n=1 Tax=Hymenobacter frigidus TaxID=1524095 RepID=A0ABQ2A9Y4_9BACT|nr:T9SS type A sorting domain-containing protein [Hymenobacter frigidus]GGH88891.1 hypothetical protein GCM10011495_31210 [Hymenobacter frigidus]